MTFESENSRQYTVGLVCKGFLLFEFWTSFRNEIKNSNLPWLNKDELVLDIIPTVEMN